MRFLYSTAMAIGDMHILLPVDAEHRLPFHVKLLFPIQLLAAPGNGPL